MSNQRSNQLTAQPSSNAPSSELLPSSHALPAGLVPPVPPKEAISSTAATAKGELSRAASGWELPDLYCGPTGISWTEGIGPRANEPFTVQWDGVNVGNAPTGPFSDLLLIWDDNNQFEIGRWVVPMYSLQPGERMLNQLNHPGLPSGRYTFYVWLGANENAFLLSEGPPGYYQNNTTFHQTFF